MEAGYVMLRLPHEVKDVFKDWLQATMPDRATKVMSLVKARAGRCREYNPARRPPDRPGPYAWTIGRRFELSCQRLGLQLPQAETGREPVQAATAAGRAAEPAAGVRDARPTPSTLSAARQARCGTSKPQQPAA
ncbi:MAG: hypothetical protein U1E16_04860 [Hyphomicrobiales bacterium]